MLFILSFLFAFAVLYFLIYTSEPSIDLTTTISDKENYIEFEQSETHQNPPMLNFKSFMMPDELGFLIGTEDDLLRVCK